MLSNVVLTSLASIYWTITLQIYAGSFFAIPLVRWFIVRNRNAEIEKRNQARQQRARALESPDVSLRRKVTAFVYFQGAKKKKKRVKDFLFVADVLGG